MRSTVLIRPTPATIEEVNTRAPSTLDIKPMAPTFIRVLGATMKRIWIRAVALLAR
jgi:hypothetical protein